MRRCPRCGAKVGDLKRCPVCDQRQYQIPLVLMCLSLAGCGTLSGGSLVPPGGAVYDYSRSPNGVVTLHIISDRDLTTPRLSLDKDGALVAEAGATTGLAAAAAQQAVLIQALLTALKGAGLIAGAP